MGRLKGSTTDKQHKIEVNKPPTFTCNQKTHKSFNNKGLRLLPVSVQLRHKLEKK